MGSDCVKICSIHPPYSNHVSISNYAEEQGLHFFLKNNIPLRRMHRSREKVEWALAACLPGKGKRSRQQIWHHRRSGPFSSVLIAVQKRSWSEDLRLKYILQVTLAHCRIIRATNLRYASVSRLGWTSIMTSKAKASVILNHHFWCICGCRRAGCG